MLCRNGARTLRVATKVKHRLQSTSTRSPTPHSQGAQRSSTWLPWTASAGASVAAFAAYNILSSQRPPLALDASTLPEPPSSMISKSKMKLIAAEEVKKHVTPESGWVVIDGVVIDVTDFLESHASLISPGGMEMIIDNLGKDISPLFNRLHASDVLQKTLPILTIAGQLDPKTQLDRVEAEDNADEVERRRNSLPEPDYIINLREFEPLAKFVLGDDSRGWKFFSSYADDGATFKATEQSFNFLRLLPRVNVPVATVDTSTTYLDSSTPVPFPIFISPTGGTANGHPDGELNMLRGAAVFGLPQTVSTMASVAFPEIGKERDELEKQQGKTRAPLWWQLYIMKDRKESERRIRLARECGAEAIIITVDVAAIGKREADAPKGKLGNGVAASTSSIFDANMTWDDIAWVSKHAVGLPVLVKGISTVEDVELAKKHGARGVFLSNHGGRQLDHSPPPLATLVRLRREKPELLQDSKFDVFIDGGVHRGTDVLKALCLGAKGVGLGRPFLYAQACYGPAGIVRVAQILQGEIESGMKLLGAKSVKDLKPEMVELLPGLVATAVIRDLLQLKRHFLAQCPSTASFIPTPPFPTARQLSQPETQDWLVQNLLHAQQSDAYSQDNPRSSTWSKGFWKRVVKGIEAGFEQREQAHDDSVDDEEVHEELLEQVIADLSWAGQTKTHSTCLRTWTWGALENPQTWMSLTTEEDERLISSGTTGLRTWQACIMLANHLISDPVVFEDTCDVLELGAGVGLLSLVAAMVLKPANVMTTDVFDQVLEKLERNVARNRMQSRVTISSLDWERASCDSGRAYLDSVLSDRRPSLVLGADIVYDPSLAGHLAGTLANILRRSGVGASALIASTIRNETTWALFQQRCGERCLDVEIIEMKTPSDGDGIVGAEGWENEGRVQLVKITLP
ncbi:hypothetical protein OIO90_000064 [Microbotryomycetes sp. JL221]|nr:hypothetical protein OIO90_000064 [Microbotryomycetes sp. JL221]